MDPLVAVGIGLAALAASIMGGIAGIGTAIVMIPVLTFALGVKVAIPVITVAMMFNNTSRWWVNRRYVDYSVALWFWAGAIPFTVLGSVVFANAPAGLLARGLGVFLLALVAYRHIPKSQDLHMGLRGFSAVGGVQGFLSGIFGGAGPFGAHFFLAYGLKRNAFVGTAAIATMAINIAKSGTYAKFALLNGATLAMSVAIGVVMVAGAYIGGLLVKRVPDRAFAYIVELVMIAAGASLLIGG